MEIYQKLLEKLFVENPWLAAFLALLPTVIPSVFLFYKSRLTTKTEREESDRVRNAKRTLEIDNQIAALGDEQKARIIELKAELLNAQINGQKGWNLARYWFGRASDLLGRYERAGSQNSALIQWVRSACKFEPKLTLPFEAVLDPPEHVTLPKDMEDIDDE